MMASGMLANEGEWNVGDMMASGMLVKMRVECWRMMTSGMLANDGEWNVGK